MYQRAPTILFLLAAAAAAAACDGTPPWADRGDGDDRAVPADLGPMAAYDRRLIFLGPGAELPTAAVFDFSVLSDSVGIRRGVRARVVDGVSWVPLHEAGWEMDPMREPWRLVPHGPIRLVVSDAGDPAAVLYEGDPNVRLESGATLAEQSPDAGTQLVLRQGRLMIDESQTSGILLDAQLARAVNPEFAPRAAPEEGEEEGEETVDGAAGAAPGGELDGAIEGGVVDSVPGEPTPTARAGAEALLLDNTGYYLVFASSAAGALGWIHSAGRDDLRRGARLEATAWEEFAGAGSQFPTAWRVVAPGSELAGELRAQAADRAPLVDPPDLSALGYVVVTGWIEDRGVRRDVFGLIRHVR